MRWPTAVGDVLHYTVQVTNTGNVTLTGVTVVDPLTGQNISGVTLAPGASQVFNSAYAITQDDLDGAGNAGSDHDIDNTATAASSQTGEQHATASVEVPLVYDPNLAIEKEFENVNGNPGEQANSVGDVINYRVTVENTGNVTLTGVSVVDPLTGQNVSGIVLAPGESQSSSCPTPSCRTISTVRATRARITISTTWRRPTRIRPGRATPTRSKYRSRRKW